MITRISENLHSDWQKELAQVVTCPEKLLKLLDINPQNYQQHLPAKKLFAVRVPRPFIALMEKGNINDPLLQQVLPLADEFTEVAGFSLDPLQEHDSASPGLLHKYGNRVLLMLRGGCAINCRYCFRRHFPYQDNQPNRDNLEQAITYLKQNNQINEVILSGGDPLMAKDEHIEKLLAQLEPIKHINKIRIHTRLPVCIPQRLTLRLKDMLDKSRLQASIVLHINHPNEIGDELKNRLIPYHRSTITLLNQSVLLKSINDNVEVLTELSEKLYQTGVLPYYLHLLDKVKGAAHFNVEQQVGIELIQQLRAKVAGYLVPTLAKEEAGHPSKTAIF
ncbi:EF-P beta-lysylation protein EpmB [Paraferrimonas sp. SM1919]|uniref:EF-P beta-lysylation protein EpmB n=1 Tax=Paraferrimonas sp. SM1919 TaxID=2662263 RepID=UPI0013D12646|nr:EF-P beta-lysylation protein EpmB [Paraferrimonas sp. SM1919]